MARTSQKKKSTSQISLGGLKIGGGAPVIVQSMTKTDTRDVRSTVSQIRELQAAGCEAVRIAVLNAEAAEAVSPIRKKIKIPLIADIHFDHKLALAAIKNGIDGLRINPGNIGRRIKVKEIVSASKDRGIPIRIGVNAGSLEKELLRKYKHPSSKALVESARRHIKILEDLDFTSIKVSLKASDVMRTVEAYRLFSEKFNYPVHIGISEAGPAFTGTVKSSIGLGILLSEGIGDTIRVSLTADPVEEVRVAYEILKSLHLRQISPELISCPTCGRCQINIREIVDKVEAKLADLRKPIKVAVMGCVVNGPGEAREADIGIAGGRGTGLLFKNGKVVKTLKERELFSTLMREIKKL
jgi:(E)-4-hydroxy-3-methylbut-2-enyl-diphosphate synthase